MKCWNCGHESSDPFGGKIAFREICNTCGAALHCCRNCIYYSPGRPNDCMVPNTDYIADRTAINFCEEFKLLGKGPTATKGPSDAAKKLFGDDLPPTDKNPKKGFDGLFKE